MHLKSREKVCIKSANITLIRKGYDIRKICQSCDQREACVYEQNIRKAYKLKPNLAITHAHLSSWLPSFFETEDEEEGRIGKYYNYLIIDETPIKTFMHKTAVSRETLLATKQILVQAGCNPILIRFYDEVLGLELNYETLLSLQIPSIDINLEVGKFTEYVMSLIYYDRIDTIPYNTINFVYYMYQFARRDNIKNMIYYHNKKLHLRYFDPFIISRLRALNPQLKILALDGTATKIVWEHMLDGPARFLRISNKYKHIYQSKSHRYPITSWRIYSGETKIHETAKKLTRLIDFVAERKKRNVLVCCTKAVKSIILLYTKFKHKLEFAIYYSLRGKNIFYKTCDTLIIACEPNPPQYEIDSYVALSGWREEIWRIVFREEEMRQAIGRIREDKDTIGSRKREKREIYIFPNTGLRGESDISDGIVIDVEICDSKNFELRLKGIEFKDKNTEIENKIVQFLPLGLRDLSSLLEISEKRCQTRLNSLIERKVIWRDGVVYRNTTKGDQKKSNSGYQAQTY